MIPGTKNFTLYRGATFGPYVFRALEEDQITVVPLTGWAAHAKVRAKPNGPIIIDLAPYISNGPGGEITIPEIADESTPAFSEGCYIWDLLLERPSGAIVGPFLAGAFTITTTPSRA